ncbi:MAG: glycosyl transferase, partial [Chitinivibrionia bacterium]|nr:glycosyl transferase [Chitinivibrionia bacterium]
NYVLCILILFRHNSRWNNFGEISLYILSVTVMGALDYGLTQGFIALSCGTFLSKYIASLFGFAGNFALRRWLVFPERRKK